MLINTVYLNQKIVFQFGFPSTKTNFYNVEIQQDRTEKNGAKTTFQAISTPVQPLSNPSRKHAPDRSRKPQKCEFTTERPSLVFRLFRGARVPKTSQKRVPKKCRNYPRIASFVQVCQGFGVEPGCQDPTPLTAFVGEKTENQRNSRQRREKGRKRWFGAEGLFTGFPKTVGKIQECVKFVAYRRLPGRFLAQGHDS